MPRLVALTAALLLLLPASASAKAALPTLIYPIVGGSTLWWDNFGDPRPQGSHQGIDMMGVRNTPVVAVEAGVIETHDSGRSGPMLYLRSKTRVYMYIHLSNDRTDENDNTGGAATAFAPGIVTGVRVKAGQHIGFLGDSGDADSAGPHLHFEEHLLSGATVNPYPRLKAATLVAFASPSPGAIQSGTVGARAEGVRLTLTGRLAWIAGMPDGTNRVALRLEKLAVAGREGFESRQLIILAVPAERIPVLAGIGVGTRVRVTTAAMPATAARQAMKPGAWALEAIEVAPAARG